jgi:16S rRNA (cytosine967-C5)-methyltransferase
MNARAVAFQVLRRVEEEGAFASRALDAALREAGNPRGSAAADRAREAGLATELVYGTLRRALTLDDALALHSTRPMASIDSAARVALRLGAYQILFLSMPAYAAVDETVGLLKKVDHGRAAGFTNAVLRSLSRSPIVPAPPPFDRDPVGHIALAESLPRWLAEEWTAWLGPDAARDLAKAMNGPAPLSVRSSQRDALLEAAQRAGLDARAGIWSPDCVVLAGGSVDALARAARDLPFQVQDEAAQAVSIFAAGELRARGQGCRILDACAAPGGKTFHLAELAGPGAEVVAIEIHPRKADQLRREAERRGLSQVRVLCADASQPIPGLELASFDAVLVDAPCAGLGTLRRHPELKLRRKPADLPRMAELQRALLRSCLTYARPGAPVTFSVCSLSRAEGPEIAATFLAQGLRRAPPTGLPPELLTPEGDLLALPSRHGTDGFFGFRLAAP